MRHSSGNRREKRPCETLPKIGGKKSGSDKARLLLEKTHLPVNLHSTLIPALLSLPARVNLLRQIIFQPNLFHDMQLPFQVVDMMLFVQQDLLE